MNLDHLPNLRLAQFFHTNAHGIPAGRWISAVGSSTEFTDLGPDLEINVLARRAKAIRVHARGGALEKLIEVHYDPKTLEYEQIAQKASVVDAHCMEGPELLLWVHGHGLMTYFCANKTSKNAVAPYLCGGTLADPKMRAKVFGLTSHVMENRNFRFWLPRLKPTDFAWLKADDYEEESRCFRLECKPIFPKPAKLNNLKEQFNALTKRFTKSFEDLIQQANDGDYGIEL
jgi:hypothetical protein